LEKVYLPEHGWCGRLAHRREEYRKWVVREKEKDRLRLPSDRRFPVFQ